MEACDGLYRERGVSPAEKRKTSEGVRGES